MSIKFELAKESRNTYTAMAVIFYSEGRSIASSSTTFGITYLPEMHFNFVLTIGGF